MILIALNALMFGAERWIDGSGQAAEFWPAVRPLFFHPVALAFGINLLYLWLFGDNVEDQLGRTRFALLYVASGLSAAGAQALGAPDSERFGLGASGAIGGVLGAYFLLYPRSRVLTLVPFPLSLHELPAGFFLFFWYLFQILTLAAIEAGSGAVQLGPAFVAHAAAFLTGAALCFALRRRERARVEWWGS